MDPLARRDDRLEGRFVNPAKFIAKRARGVDHAPGLNIDLFFRGLARIGRFEIDGAKTGHFPLRVLEEPLGLDIVANHSAMFGSGQNDVDEQLRIIELTIRV